MKAADWEGGGGKKKLVSCSDMLHVWMIPVSILVQWQRQEKICTVI